MLRLTLISIWVLVACVAAFLVRDVSLDRAATQARVEHDVSVFARLVEEHSTATIERADLALLSVRDRLMLADMKRGVALESHRLAELGDLLKNQQAATRGVVSMSITDANGVVYANSVGTPPGVSLASRRYFQTLQSAPRQTPVFSEAVLGRVSNKWGVQVARRLDFPDGQFAGMVVANLGIDENFDSIYTALGLEKNYVVSLRDDENRLIFRRPRSDDLLGKVLPTGELGNKIVAGEKEGVISVVSVIDGVQRVAGFRKSPIFPVYSVIAPATDDLLQGWRKTRNQVGSLVAALIAAALYLSYVLYRREMDGIKAARVLATSETNYRALFNSAEVGMFQYRTDGAEIVNANDKLLSILGGTREQVISQSLLLWVQPQQHQDLMAAMAADGHVNNLEIQVYHQHRDVRHCILSLNLNRTTGLTDGSLLDISDRKRAEESLKASEQRFRDMVDTTDGIVWEADAQAFTFTYVSQKAETLLGFPVVSWYEPGFWVAHLHPEDRQWAPQYCASCTGRAEPHDFEYRFVASDGRTVWLRDIVTVQTEAGRPRWLRGIMVDISSQKRDEAIIVSARDRLNTILQTTRDAFWLVNLTGKLLDVNSAACELLGYSREEMLGRSIADFEAVHDSERIRQNIDLCLQTGSILFESQHRARDGRYLDVEISVSYVPAESVLVSFIRDISQRISQQKQLEQIAHFDALTALPNRVLLADRMHQAMAQAIRPGSSLAVVYLDLDGFKAINDQHGHNVGDMFLKLMARQVQDAMRQGDTLARIGGDEFVAVLQALPDHEASIPVLQRMLAAAAEVFVVDGLTLSASASLGVTFYPQAHDIDADQLLRQADQAMYHAKLAGKNRYQIFDAARDNHARLHDESL